MKNFQVSNFSNFFMVGVDHSTAEVDVREKFSLSEQQCRALISEYQQAGGDGIMVISTCNRTEIYAFGDCPRNIISLLCKHSEGDITLFYKHQKIKQNRAAIEHLFEVGAGLQSRILGDFEIIGQVKKSYQRSRELQAHNPFLDRLVNACVQASKRVKNETEICTGASSVAFAAVQQVKNHQIGHPYPKVVLVGTGKIGKTACENLVNQTGWENITLVNRTGEKAERLAKRFGVNHVPYSELQPALNTADVVIVATGAEKPTVLKEHFEITKNRLFLDLSMPRNVDADLYNAPGFEVVDVDHLSLVTEENMEMRSRQIPVALNIISEVVGDFYIWLESRRVAPTLQSLRQKMDQWSLMEIQALSKKFPDLNADQAEALSKSLLNRITGQLARQLKNGSDLNGDLRTIHHIFELEK